MGEVNVAAMVQLIANRLGRTPEEIREAAGPRGFRLDFVAATKSEARDSMNAWTSLAERLEAATKSLEALPDSESVWLALRVHRLTGDSLMREPSRTITGAAAIARQEAEEWRLEYESWGRGPGRGAARRGRFYALGIARCFVAFDGGKLSAAGSEGNPTSRLGKLVRDAFIAGGLDDDWETATRWAVEESRLQSQPTEQFSKTA